MMSSVYANATFGVFTNTFFEEVSFPWREIEVIQRNGLVTAPTVDVRLLGSNHRP
jgi:hypothetical protein